MLRHGFRALLVLSSLLVVAFYLAAALPVARGTGPAATADPVEIAVLAQANRLLDHVPPYAEPSANAPVVPMPGFASAVSLLVGADDAQLWVVRQLALLATLVTAVLAFGIIRFETGGWTLPLGAATLMLLAPALFGAPPGAGRPESIALLFVLLGFASLRFTIGVVGAIAGSVLLSIAFFVHAPAVWFVAAAALSLAFEDRRRCTAFAIAALALVGGGYVVLSALLGPWFNFAAWDVPLRALGLAGGDVLPFVAGHLLGRLGVCTLAAVLSFAISTQPWHERRGIWMWLGMASIVASLATGTEGSAAASLHANFVGALLVGAIALDLVARHLADSFGSAGHEGESVIFAAVLLQGFVIVALAPTPAWVAGAISTFTGG